MAGYDLRRLRRRDIPYLRRRIGIVFQDYQLLTDRNVFMNLYYVMKATGWKREDQIRERIDQVLGLVEPRGQKLQNAVRTLGGEQQRLVIARALLNDPQVLLADEPTGNLDPVTAEGIMRLFQKIAGRGCAVVMSTHNTALIENYPARAILFAQGKNPRGRPQSRTRITDRKPHAAASRPMLRHTLRGCLRNVLQPKKSAGRSQTAIVLFGIYFLYLYDILKTTDEYRIRKRKKSKKKNIPLRISRFSKVLKRCASAPPCISAT